MITELHVKNLALIDEAEVPFGEKLNILTGETGAGKSILIGSINLALGQKITKEMQKNAEQPTIVELVFQVNRRQILQKLKKMDVEPADGYLVITRKFQGGRSLTRLNGETCSAAKIRDIASLLLDIHGQHEHQSLLYPARQLEILDAYGKDELKDLPERTAEAFHRYTDLKKELERYTLRDDERNRERSFLEYEIHEIEAAALCSGEDEKLEQEYRKMVNSRKIVEALGRAQQYAGGENAAEDLLGCAVRELEGIAGYDEKLHALYENLLDLDSMLQDFCREAGNYLEAFTFSEEEFQQKEERLDLLNRLKSKYGRTLEDVLAYADSQKKRLFELENYEVRRADLQKKLQQAEKELQEVSEALSNARKQCAEGLSEAIKKELEDLNFLSVSFAIRFSRTESYGKNGFDAITFQISTNPGEALRPLSKVVSGGELSRIMLAIKTLLADRDETETLIFDEIDTGISGRTAQKVSEKMARISRDHQVICITHLAQIAAMADTHFVIRKAADADGTRTTIRELGEKETEEELARILGGAELTDVVYENAREMKRLAEQKKEVLRKKN